MPVCRYQKELVATIVDIADFAGLFRPQKIKICVFELFHTIPSVEAKPYWPESMLAAVRRCGNRQVPCVRLGCGFRPCCGRTPCNLECLRAQTRRRHDQRRTSTPGLLC